MNTQAHQPSVKSLILSCCAATVLAMIIFITAVLPAEFNIDPTGLGSRLGLTQLAKVEDQSITATVIQCPESGNMEQSAKAGDKVTEQSWKDTVLITVPAGKGIEYKFILKKSKMLEFVWNTDGEKLYFDFHGEPAGDKTGYFKSFKVSTQSESSGVLTAPFDGTHGWYWENKSRRPVKVLLKTRGDYQIKGLI